MVYKYLMFLPILFLAEASVHLSTFSLSSQYLINPSLDFDKILKD